MNSGLGRKLWPFWRVRRPPRSPFRTFFVFGVFSPFAPGVCVWGPLPFAPGAGGTALGTEGRSERQALEAPRRVAERG